MRYGALSMVCVVAIGSELPGPPEQAPRTPVQAMQYAVRALIAEAETAKEEGRLIRQRTDFAAEFEREQGVDLEPAAVWTRMRKPVHRDPFIDAYVRWQLTAFDPAFPEGEALKDDDFAEFISDLPPLMLNPRSDREMIVRINRLVASPEVDEAVAESLRQQNEQLASDTSRVNNLNKPALELRRWLEEQVGKSGPRVHLVRLERCAALASRGWNVQAAKRSIGAGFDEARKDRALTDLHRASIARQARSLIGLRTPIVTRIGATEGVPEAQFDEAAVYDFEVNAWIRSLQGR